MEPSSIWDSDQSELKLLSGLGGNRSDKRGASNKDESIGNPFVDYFSNSLSGKTIVLERVSRWWCQIIFVIFTPNLGVS